MTRKAIACNLKKVSWLLLGLVFSPASSFSAPAEPLRLKVEGVISGKLSPVNKENREIGEISHESFSSITPEDLSFEVGDPGAPDDTAGVNHSQYAEGPFASAYEVHMTSEEPGNKSVSLTIYRGDDVIYRESISKKFTAAQTVTHLWRTPSLPKFFGKLSSNSQKAVRQSGKPNSDEYIVEGLLVKGAGSAGFSPLKSGAELTFPRSETIKFSAKDFKKVPGGAQSSVVEGYSMAIFDDGRFVYKLENRDLTGMDVSGSHDLTIRIGDDIFLGEIGSIPNTSLSVEGKWPGRVGASLVVNGQAYGKGSFEHRWVMLGKPDASKLQKHGGKAEWFEFVPDVPGRYAFAFITTKDGQDLNLEVDDILVEEKEMPAQTASTFLKATTDAKIYKPEAKALLAVDLLKELPAGDELILDAKVGDTTIPLKKVAAKRYEYRSRALTADFGNKWVFRVKAITQNKAKLAAAEKLLADAKKAVETAKNALGMEADAKKRGPLIAALLAAHEKYYQVDREGAKVKVPFGPVVEVPFQIESASGESGENEAE